MKTNVLKKNPYYKDIVKLYEFLQKYDDIGYAINVIEQAPEISEDLQTDVFHNVMFNYIILKNYLDEDKGREIPAHGKEKKRTLRPKFIKEIIEELTEDYDLPDVEVRKVLIEELTKSDLMKEEAEERLRLVEEQERLKREEEERLRREKEEEEERIRLEKEQEEERIRKEKEAEEMRIKAERMRREMEDYRRGNIFKRELEALFGKIGSRLETREEEEHLRLSQAEKQEFEDAARILEEQEQRKKEENERLRKRLEEEKAQALWEQQQEELRRKAEEEARLAAERAREEEERRIAEEAQKQKDREYLKLQLAELELFMNNLESSIKYRRNYKGEDEGEKTGNGDNG
jgi:trichohyalin